jgi:hypothetical protein
MPPKYLSCVLISPEKSTAPAAKPHSRSANVSSRQPKQVAKVAPRTSGQPAKVAQTNSEQPTNTRQTPNVLRPNRQVAPKLVVKTTQKPATPPVRKKTAIPWTVEAASRIYRADARDHGGKVRKDTFAADAMSMAMKEQRPGKKH